MKAKKSEIVVLYMTKICTGLSQSYDFRLQLFFADYINHLASKFFIDHVQYYWINETDICFCIKFKTLQDTMSCWITDVVEYLNILP